MGRRDEGVRGEGPCRERAGRDAGGNERSASEMQEEHLAKLSASPATATIPICRGPIKWIRVETRRILSGGRVGPASSIIRALVSEAEQHAMAIKVQGRRYGEIVNSHARDPSL